MVESLTVDLKMPYKPLCGGCMQDVEQTVAAAVRDRQVTSLRLTAVASCRHDAAAPTSRGSIAATRTAPLSTVQAVESLPLPLEMIPEPGPATLPGGFDAGM